jgi:hypothetical protein
MEKHARALTATQHGPGPRWDQSAFRLHTLAMNPDLAVMASLASVESREDAPPVHWMQQDPVLAPILKSALAQEKSIARMRGANLASDSQTSADILVRLGMSRATEPKGIVACISFALRTISQHRDMESAAHARRPGRSNA